MTEDEEKNRHYVNSLTMQTDLQEIDARQAPSIKYNATLGNKQIIMAKVYTQYAVRTRGWKPKGRYPIKNGFYELSKDKNIMDCMEKYIKYLRNMIEEEEKQTTKFELEKPTKKLAEEAEWDVYIQSK